MPYEYAYEKVGIAIEDVEAGGLVDWLNLYGERDWRIVNLGVTVDRVSNIMDFYAVFERKIEINKNLRALQEGKEIEKEILDDGSIETDEN